MGNNYSDKHVALSCKAMIPRCGFYGGEDEERSEERSIQQHSKPLETLGDGDWLSDLAVILSAVQWP